MENFCAMNTQSTETTATTPTVRSTPALEKPTPALRKSIQDSDTDGLLFHNYKSCFNLVGSGQIVTDPCRKGEPTQVGRSVRLYANMVNH